MNLGLTAQEAHALDKMIRFYERRGRRPWLQRGSYVFAVLTSLLMATLYILAAQSIEVPSSLFPEGCAVHSAAPTPATTADIEMLRADMYWNTAFSSVKSQLVSLGAVFGLLSGVAIGLLVTLWHRPQRDAITAKLLRAASKEAGGDCL